MGLVYIPVLFPGLFQTPLSPGADGSAPESA